MKTIFTVLLIVLNSFSFAQNAKKSDNKNDLNSSVYQETITEGNLDEKIISQGLLIAANNYRNKKGKNSMQDNALLHKAACLHSEQMKLHNFFSHINNKNKKLKTAEDRANNAGYNNYSFLAENIFFGSYNFQANHNYQYIIDDILKTFYQSPPHNKNLLETRAVESGICTVIKINQAKNSYDIYVTHLMGK
jgi:uncharacterized protein YkwD